MEEGDTVVLRGVVVSVFEDWVWLKFPGAKNHYHFTKRSLRRHDRKVRGEGDELD